MNHTIIKILLVLGILVAGYFLTKASIRIIRAFISYKKLGKEEFKKRLKRGYEQITPTQRAKIELRGMIISLLGVVIGLIVTPIYRIEGVWYWVEISLVGALILMGIQLLSKLQEYKLLKKQDELLKQLGDVV